MYVCLCNAVSYKPIRAAVRLHQPQTFQQLKRLVLVGTRCGQCVCVARRIMEDELQHIAPLENIA
ncbi:bacterioferritin-associated ferredoxin [Sodalis-like symbiont of Bactericera trigonica]|nr:bacterioferritin-associated ferredoxin [Sodalis-like symbiont of Bactericera trigonica]